MGGQLLMSHVLGVVSQEKNHNSSVHLDTTMNNICIGIKINIMKIKGN